MQLTIVKHMDNEINQRVRDLILSKGLSQKEFSQTLDVSQSIVTYIINDRNKVSLDVIQKIARNYPEINLKWLLLGEGEMLQNTPLIDASKVDELMHEVEIVNKLNYNNLKRSILEVKTALKS